MGPATSASLPTVWSLIYMMLSGHLQAKTSSLGGLEPPTFRLTAERTNWLRHRERPDQPFGGCAIDLQAEATTLGGKAES